MAREILDMSNAYEYMTDKVAKYITKLKYVDELIELYNNNEDAYYIEAILESDFQVKACANCFCDIYEQVLSEIKEGLLLDKDMKERIIQLIEELKN